MLTNDSFPFRRRALVLALTLVSGAANAVNINVRGDCKLIAAIDNANTDSDTDGAGFGCEPGNRADTLILKANATYTLNKIVKNEEGLPWITSTITINGQGSKIVRSSDSGTPYFRLFHVTTQGDLTLNRLTLTGGKTQSNGGAISNVGFITLNNCVISGNRVQGYLSIPSIGGGGIVNNNTMILNSTIVSDNAISVHYLGTGGGILNTGNMVLNKSTIKDNGAFDVGGISNSGKMTLNDSIVSHNIAGESEPSSGAAGISNSGNMVITNSTVSNNWNAGSHVGPYMGIGGIKNTGNMILSNSTVSANGRAISNSASMTLINSTVSLNYNGSIENSGNMALTGSQISRNFTSSYFGGRGGIGNSGNLTISNSAISHNISPSFDGSGIRNDLNGTVLLTNSIISDNKAVGGAGISNFGTMQLSNNLISNNKAVYSSAYFPGDGGGIYNKGNMTLINNTLSGNSSHQSGGGIANKGSLVLSHTTISGNHAAVEGGGIKNIPGADMILSNSLIANSPFGGDCNNEGIFTLQGANLIEDGSCGAPLSGDPKLAPLLDNGGFTLTRALQVGSAAIDSADKTLCVATDQRNISRPTLTGFRECDIGAFERIVEIPSSVSLIVQFFDQHSANGEIIGTKLSVKSRLEALRNQLLVAGRYKNRSKITDACAQLARTFKQIDLDNAQDFNDLVTGSAARELADQVIDLRTDWLCK